MPRFDRKCEACGWELRDVWERSDDQRLCDDCGEPTVRAWLTAPPNVIGDEWDHVQKMGTKHPIHFTSKIEHRRWLKANNYRIMDDGDGKGSKMATALDPQTLANATELVNRAATQKNRGWRDPELAPIGITSDDGVIRYLTDRNRAENRGEFGFSDR